MHSEWVWMKGFSPLCISRELQWKTLIEFLCSCTRWWPLLCRNDLTIGSCIMVGMHFQNLGSLIIFLLFCFFHVSSTIRYFSSRSASCCIPGKKARSQKTRVKTDTRISSPVSQTATCRFLSPQLPVERVTQIDERRRRGLSKVSRFTSDNSQPINWLSIWKKKINVIPGNCWHSVILTTVGFSAFSRHNSCWNQGSRSRCCWFRLHQC